MSVEKLVADKYFNYSNVKSRYSKEHIEDVSENKKGLNERDKMILSCMKMVIYEAMKYRESINTKENSVSVASFEDLVQAGLEGVIIAYDRFDPSKETKFSSYAHFWIIKKILHHINVVESPLTVTELEGHNRVTSDFFWISKDNDGGVHNDEDFDNYFDKLTKGMNELTVDLNQGISNEVKAIHEIITNGMECLLKREKKVICCYFGLAPFKEPTDFKGVSSYIKLSKTETEKIFVSGMAKLKDYFEDMKKKQYDNVITQLNVLSSNRSLIPASKPYVDSDMIFGITLDEVSQNIVNNSEVSQSEGVDAIHVDLTQSHKFISERNILGLRVVKEYVFIKRYKKHGGTASVSISFKAFDSQGNEVIPLKFIKNEHSVRMKEIGDYFSLNRITRIEPNNLV